MLGEGCLPLTGRSIIIRDTTLREGLDVPGVDFDLAQRLRIAALLADTGIAQMEIVAPSRVVADSAVAREIRQQGLDIRTSGLVYAMSPTLGADLVAAGESLDDVDLLISPCPQRKPTSLADKRARLLATLEMARGILPRRAGVGFPNATQSDPEVVLELAAQAEGLGASRLTLYDTNGGADPFSVFALVAAIKNRISIPIYFHGHNDLGMAVANSLSALLAGADGVDTTVTGLGDRAGNCPLEPLAVAVAIRGGRSGIKLDTLRSLAEGVAQASGVAVSPLTPVVGEYVFLHKSPGHLEIPALFEAFPPAMVGAERRFVD